MGLAILLVVTEVVAGWRVLGPSWQGGDLLYHSALAQAVLRGELPPGGPYAGLPTYYPPGFHALLAAIMAATGLDFTRADQLLTMLWLPVLPIGTFLLVRWLTGRSWVAVLAAALTVFAGGYDVNAGRLWVNSLFLSGQEAYPVYPRDLVFGLLPFAVLAFLRGLATARIGRAAGWAILSGVLFGVCALTQVQLLLPLPVALLAVAGVVAATGRGRVWRAMEVSLVTGGTALVLFAPWFIGQLALIRRNGGVGLDSVDALVPAHFGPWSYPREFGVVLPLAIIGCGVALLLLRRRDGPRPGGVAMGPWRPPVAGAPVVLVTWFVVAFAAAVLYQPSWPLEDALRPQRLWLLSSQPMAMLAAIGLVAIAEDVAGRIRARSWRLDPALAIVAGGVAVACIPVTLATSLLLASTWTRPTYALLNLARDRVPAFATLLPRGTPRVTVLTYEDWSALTWFETGEHVVAIVPSGFSKLAYDPAVFTAHGQDQRRADVLAALDGDPARLAAAAAAYDARYLILARRGDRLGVLDAAAVTASRQPHAVTGSATATTFNGWDALAMAAGASLDIAVGSTSPLDLEIRALAASTAGQTFAVATVAQDGTVRSRETVAIPVGAADAWVVVRVAVDVQSGDHLRLEAVDPVTVQSARGFAANGPIENGAAPVPGWRITTVTADAVVLEPGG